MAFEIPIRGVVSTFRAEGSAAGRTRTGADAMANPSSARVMPSA